MSPSELTKEIKSGKFRPIYYFYGSEDYRIKEAEKALVARFLPKAQQTTNHTTVSAAKSKLEDILTELSIIPMLGERQLFTITDIQSLSQSNIEKILSLLTPADPNRLVIFSTPSAKLPRKNSKILKFLISEATPVEFPRLKEGSARNRIVKQLDKADVKIDRDALDMLTRLSGGDLAGILQEVDKLIDFVGTDGTITKKEVSELTVDYQVFKVFELAGFAALGDFDKSLSIINFLLNRGEKISGILFWLSDHFIGLYLTQNKKRYAQNKSDISWKFKGQLGLYENSRLEMIIHLIAEADREIRLNTGQDRLILERLIFQICSEKKKAADA